jgi:hypothetical protein
MSSTGNEPIDNRYETYVPYNWRQQVVNAFSTAIAYVFTAVQTFTAGIKTNDIFCETAGAIQATLFSDVGFGRDVIIGNALSNTRLNNVEALTSSSGCNFLINQVSGIATLCDAPSRTAPLNIYSKGTTPAINTITIGTTGVDINMLGELHSNQLDNISAHDPAKIYHSQHHATATLEIADHNNRVGGLNIFTRGEAFTDNTIKIGSAGNTTTEMEGTTKIVRLKSTYLDTFVNSEDVVLYSENLTGYVKIADAPTRTGGVNIFSKGTTPVSNTIKIGANSATTTELDGITKISNPLFLDYTTATTAGTLGYVISDPSTSSVVLSTTFATIRTITLTAGTWIITGSVSENNASGTEVGGVVLLYNNTAGSNIRVVYDEFPVYAYSTAPIVTFLYLSVSSVIELRASLNAVRTGVSAIGESYLQAVRIG